jgi:hypothetical protein
MSASTRRAAFVAIVYVVLFGLAAWLDLATTALALTREGTSEGNVYAGGPAGYDPARAWLISAAGGLFIGGFLAFALLAQGEVSEVCLARPIRSFAKLYVNPFARGVRDRAPLHMLSFVIAFIPLRLIAAANNLAIFAFGTAPLGRLVGRVSRLTNPTIAFWLVLGTLFYGLAFASAPVAAAVIRRLRRPGRGSPRAAPAAP